MSDLSLIRSPDKSIITCKRVLQMWWARLNFGTRKSDGRMTLWAWTGLLQDSL